MATAADRQEFWNPERMSTHVHEGKGSLLHWSEGSETEEEAVPQGKFYFHVAWPGLLLI